MTAGTQVANTPRPGRVCARFTSAQALLIASVSKRARPLQAAAKGLQNFAQPAISSLICRSVVPGSRRGVPAVHEQRPIEVPPGASALFRSIRLRRASSSPRRAAQPGSASSHRRPGARISIRPDAQGSLRGFRHLMIGAFRGSMSCRPESSARSRRGMKQMTFRGACRQRECRPAGIMHEPTAT